MVLLFSLVSHGKDVEGKNACYAYYDSTTQIGYGPSYQNSCIHSGSNDYSGGDTVWYNYVIASAGTIFDENTTADNPVNNTTNATESICPKGWTLPNNTQMNSIGSSTGTATYVSSFSPTLGGFYNNGSLDEASTYGRYWSSTNFDKVQRNILTYNGNNGTLTKNGRNRRNGIYIRCVPKS